MNLGGSTASLLQLASVANTAYSSQLDFNLAVGRRSSKFSAPVWRLIMYGLPVDANSTKLG